MGKQVPSTTRPPLKKSELSEPLKERTRAENATAEGASSQAAVQNPNKARWEEAMGDAMRCAMELGPVLARLNKSYDDIRTLLELPDSGLASSTASGVLAAEGVQMTLEQQVQNSLKMCDTTIEELQPPAATARSKLSGSSGPSDNCSSLASTGTIHSTQTDMTEVLEPPPTTSIRHHRPKTLQEFSELDLTGRYSVDFSLVKEEVRKVGAERFVEILQQKGLCPE